MYIIFAFIAGFLIGVLRQEILLESIYKAQQERGDYWYDEYITINEPLSKD